MEFHCKDSLITHFIWQKTYQTNISFESYGLALSKYIYFAYVILWTNKVIPKMERFLQAFCIEFMSLLSCTELCIYEIELHKKQVLRQVCWICLMPWYLFCVQFTRTRCFKSDYIHLCTFYTHISYNTCAYTNSVTSTGLYRKYLIKIAFFM